MSKIKKRLKHKKGGSRRTPLQSHPPGQPNVHRLRDPSPEVLIACAWSINRSDFLTKKHSNLGDKSLDWILISSWNWWIFETEHWEKHQHSISKSEMTFISFICWHLQLQSVFFAAIPRDGHQPKKRHLFLRFSSWRSYFQEATSLEDVIPLPSMYGIFHYLHLVDFYGTCR